MAAFITMFKSMNLRYQLSSMISMYDNFNGETAKKMDSGVRYWDKPIIYIYMCININNYMYNYIYIYI